MDAILPLFSDPAAWAALIALVVMEVVLGIDNLIFISILSNKLPEDQRQRVRRIGIGLALIMRLALLSIIAWLVGLTQPVFELWGNAFSWKDLILIAGGLFLVWKATKEIHHSVDPIPSEHHDLLDKKDVVISNAGAAIFQIILLDLVFSIDSILTAVGMTEHLPIMVVAVLVSVSVMLLAADPLAATTGPWTRSRLPVRATVHGAGVRRRATVHRAWFDPSEVQKSQLLSIKTGGCAENCGYCSQSASFDTGLKAEKLMDATAVIAEAMAAKDGGANASAWARPGAN
jgi:predicted tellurium resistance membrane protein TerC